MRPVRLSAPFLLAVGLLAAPSARAADDALGQPTAKLCFGLRDVALAGGYSWGKGRLYFGGHSYPVRISGGGAVGIGYSRLRGEGTVYNLARLSDINGTYWSVRAEATIARGRNVAVLDNNHGVDIKTTMHTTGAHLAAAVMRLTLRVDPGGERVETAPARCTFPIH
ncbi:hypothetical protein SXCC_03469 [Gluconacetobacter sp. SXCC-1]|uniref:hypothetical protein n=1 Tax=Komagataeibacter rhaeticus TaxID=215221 RepID=UPI000207F9AB|nr:hypothetical protein [Komagataeibacter rhaeticus]EGG76109.1 hypothetical protein SXCC_03469 [Gluconacetobacter sp. SXCC-1]KDU94462.1 hypothetical protein GLUCORHAEAF1_14415 [Komagataeibacter rhaeticus AF1]MBL7240454.1 hypothetical protein [Komagataeibacter rhaeticus]QOC47353.1 hypothetical protein ICJ78_04360 [Komagataeibacter rhaeticus]WPP23246.1 hypothetical protein SCD25_07275 [Komagataeibacter rhaeticus]